VLELLECSKRLKAQLQQQEELERLRAALESPLLMSQQQQQQEEEEEVPAEEKDKRHSSGTGRQRRFDNACGSSSSSRCLKGQGSSKTAGGYSGLKKPQRLRSLVQAARTCGDV
jgi:hypothetical protein